MAQIFSPWAGQNLAPFRFSQIGQDTGAPRDKVESITIRRAKRKDKRA
jgi:hypothetical protein